MESWPVGRALPVTCVRNGREHLVSWDAMEVGRSGRYVALCGCDVMAAALASPPGPPCSRCIAVRSDRAGRSHSAGRRARHR
ncbi:MAG: hypothetical protein ACRDT0_15720, partial [Pseudonocardiaceae bacterium]